IRHAVVFVRDSIHYGVKLIHICAHSRGRLLNSRIDLGDGNAAGIAGLYVGVDLFHEICDGLNAEIDPATEMGVGDIADPDIVTRIETGFATKRSDGVVIETRPAFLPTCEVRHPVRDVHVHAVDAGSGDLADDAHVSLTPFGRKRGHPDILISLPDPEGLPAAEDCRRS